jgi:hypothetical protein
VRYVHTYTYTFFSLMGLPDSMVPFHPAIATPISPIYTDPH